MVNIHHMNLNRVDLNLLVAFDALLSEQSVTRAAERLGLSQPAMSSALGRLRRLVGDPILVRTATRMVPTQRAMELVGPVREILRQIEVALSAPAPFDPASTKRRFRIATNDYVEVVLLPKLVRELARVAPGIDLDVRPLGPDFPDEAMQTGKLDLAIGFAHSAPVELHSQILFKDRFICAVRADHPGVGRRLTPQQYADLPHVMVSPSGGVTGVVDSALSLHGLERRVAVTVPHFVVAPHVVAQSDCIVTLAERVARSFAEILPLRLLKPPVVLPGFRVAMIWHERSAHDPAQQWLRETLKAVSRMR
jgi:DNA-binding transcriptional LysR family regulator